MSLHPNVRRCTHIQVTGHRCGSPALKQEYFCYFHSRMIKGVQTRVDSQIHPVALIESAEANQAALMHMIDAVLKGAIDNKRAALVLKALYIAVRNSRNVYFSIRQDDMVREVPNYAQQYLAENPAPTPEPRGDSRPASTEQSRRGCLAERSSAAPFPQPCVILSEAADSPSESAAQSKDPDVASGCNGASGNFHHSPERNSNAAGRDNIPPLTTRQSERWNEIKKLEASVEHAMRGDWRALRTVFNAVGLAPNSHNAQRVKRHRAPKPTARKPPKSALNLDPRVAAEDNCAPEVQRDRAKDEGSIQ